MKNHSARKTIFRITNLPKNEIYLLQNTRSPSSDKHVKSSLNTCANADSYVSSRVK